MRWGGVVEVLGVRKFLEFSGFLLIEKKIKIIRKKWLYLRE